MDLVRFFANFQYVIAKKVVDSTLTNTFFSYFELTVKIAVYFDEKKQFTLIKKNHEKSAGSNTYQ